MESDIAFTSGSPRPALPLLWLYHARDRYTLVVPDEYQRRLAKLPARFFDTCLARTRELDDFLNRVEVMVELRGVVTRMEALLPLREMLGKRDPEFHIGGLLRRLEEDELNFQDVDLPGFRDGAYVHVDQLDEPGRLLHGSGLRDPRRLGAIVGNALRCQPRDAAEFSDLDALERWMRGHASYQALVTYLDGRVPEGADDRSWAVDYADGIVNAARALYGADGVSGLMFAEDLELSEAQRVHIVDLIGTLLNDVWRWANNGWSPDEVSKGLDAGEAAPSAKPARTAPPARPAPPEIKVTPRRPKRKRPHKKHRR